MNAERPELSEEAAALHEVSRLMRRGALDGLDDEAFAHAVAEGQELRRRYDRDSAGMRVLTAEDRARVSR